MPQTWFQFIHLGVFHLLVLQIWMSYWNLSFCTFTNFNTSGFRGSDMDIHSLPLPCSEDEFKCGGLSSTVCKIAASSTSGQSTDDEPTPVWFVCRTVIAEPNSPIELAVVKAGLFLEEDGRGSALGFEALFRWGIFRLTGFLGRALPTSYTGLLEGMTPV